MPESRGGVWRREEAIGAILRELLQGEGLGRGGRPDTMRKAWLDAVGPDIGRQTRVVGLRRTTLVVEVESSVLRQELALYRQEAIVACLQGILGAGAVRDIQFRTGRF